MTANGKSPQDVVIVGARRTPIGRFQGILASKTAPELGAIAVEAAVEQAGIEIDEVGEVFMGQVVSAGSGMAPARQASIFGGLPETVSAVTINKLCGSGLKAVMMAATGIKAGEAPVMVAGGMESMTNAPYLLPNARGGMRFGHQEVLDSNIKDGLWCSFEHWMMGNAAEFIGREYEVTREQMDAFAFSSHQKAVDAMDNGRFTEEIVPVPVKVKRKEMVISTDEAPRRDTNPDVLAKLRPAFEEDGSVTAGNAPGLNDGAAAVVLTTRAYAEEHGLTPLARIVAYGQAAVDPKWVFDAPSKAIPVVLEKAGWDLADVDLIELNEAFAAQTLANGRALSDNGWDWEKVNVNGGAIALGHPVGASGTRVLVTLIYALRQRQLSKGIAALCLGGGEAVGMAIELE